MAFEQRPSDKNLRMNELIGRQSDLDAKSLEFFAIYLLYREPSKFLLKLILLDVFCCVCVNARASLV